MFQSTSASLRRPRHIRTERRIMGVMVHPCHANYHIPGVCTHPGSKPDLKQRTERRRAKNKVARHSRRINR